MHDLIRTEGPALLGYLALAGVLAVFVFVTYLASSECRDRRARNRAARIRRHAAAGCEVCRLRLLVAAGNEQLAKADAQATELDAAAFLDFPTGGPR